MPKKKITRALLCAISFQVTALLFIFVIPLLDIMLLSMLGAGIGFFGSIPPGMTLGWIYPLPIGAPITLFAGSFTYFVIGLFAGFTGEDHAEPLWLFIGRRLAMMLGGLIGLTAMSYFVIVQR